MTQQPRGPELSYDLDEDQEQPHPTQPLPQAIKAEHLKPLAPLRRHKLVKSVVALLILVGLAAIIPGAWPPHGTKCSVTSPQLAAAWHKVQRHFAPKASELNQLKAQL
jgi:hypothetical protein